YLKRIWDNSAEDNVLFLAGGIAFNILLAAIPFFLLLVAGLTYLLPALFQKDPSMAVNEFIDSLLPMHTEAAGSAMHTMLADVLRNLEYTIGRLLAFIFITMMFFALYKYLPLRNVRTRTALLAALFSGVLFEAAQQAFREVLRSMNPSTLSTGTIAALVIVVV